MRHLAKLAPLFFVLLLCVELRGNACADVFVTKAGPVKGLLPPRGAIVVSPTTANIDQTLAKAAKGATIYFKKGAYQDLQIRPKTGQRYLAEYGTILTSQTQLYAFNGFEQVADNVVIQNFVIDGYLPPDQCSAISAGTLAAFGKKWTIQDCEIRNSRAGGVQVFDHSKVDNTLIHHCGQIGIKMFGQSPKLTDSEIAFNNPAHKYDVFWEAGGSKFWNTTDVRIENNVWHDNVGCGIWLDFKNSGGTVRRNHCYHNTLSGIYQEIGGAMLIEENTCENNGTEYNQPGWLLGAGIVVEASPGVVVRKNICRDNANGIGIIATQRGPGWNIADVTVESNIVVMDKGLTGVVWDGQAPLPWNGVKFRKNQYTISADNMFAWQGAALPSGQWKNIDLGAVFGKSP